MTISGAPGEDMKPFSFSYAWVPSAGLVRLRGEGGDYEWAEAAPNTTRVLARTAAGLEPRAATTLKGLDVVPAPTVTHRPVTPPAPSSSPARDGGGAPWGWIVLAAGAVLGGGLVALRLRRGRGTGPAPVTG